MLVENMPRMRTVGLRDVGHARIVNTVVAGDAAVNGAERRDTDLLHLDAVFDQQFAAAVVGGLVPKKSLIPALYALPLREVVLLHGSAHQVADGDEAGHQQQPAINP